MTYRYALVHNYSSFECSGTTTLCVLTTRDEDEATLFLKQVEDDYQEYLDASNEAQDEYRAFILRISARFSEAIVERRAKTDAAWKNFTDKYPSLNLTEGGYHENIDGVDYIAFDLEKLPEVEFKLPVD